MADEKILVEILNGTQVHSGCDCTSCPSSSGCGPSSSQEEMVNKLAEDLREAFGTQVEVHYVDVDKEGLDNYPAMSKVLQMGYPYPVTIINGEPRYAGGIMITEVKQSIKEIIGDQE
jgi:disulfide oxidoreductase YuzD